MPGWCRIASLVMALGLSACAAPPRPADLTLPSGAVRREFFEVEVRVHRYSARGARVPDEAFAHAVATLERHLGRGVRVVDHGEMDSGWGVDGPIAPILDGGRPIGAAEIAGRGGRYLVAEGAGVLGAIDQRVIAGYEESPTRALVLVEPGTILVVELPGPEGGAGVTGYATALAVAAGGSTERRTGVVVLSRSAIARRSGLFVSESRLAQWTLTHEIGHVLGVPASNTHIWKVPGLGPHCTHPECVMYTGLDWRVVVTGLLTGWPLDYCERCAAELGEARAAASSSGASGTDAGG